ncbi:MAG: hypothetical protein ACK4K9_10125 [Bacteroidia bacterium]
MKQNTQLEGYPLKGLEGYKNAFQLLRITIVTLIAGMILLTVFGIVFVNKNLKEATRNIWVMAADGSVIRAEAKDATNLESRVYEYRNHVKMFYSYWYAFDQNNFKENIEKGLYLVGDCGKSLWKKYQEESLERKVMENNLIVKVDIKEVKIDINSIPVKGVVYAIQKVKRPSGEIARHLDAVFDLYDVSRSDVNPHGVLIENFEIINSEVINE